MSYEKEKRIDEINLKILVSARNELYLHLRFLDVALSTLRYQMDAGTDTIGTDGIGQMELDFIIIRLIWADCIEKGAEK